MSIWPPNQVESPRPIRSELHVECLKRLKHAVHNEWFGTFLMTIIKNYSILHPQHLCNLYLVNILLLVVLSPCTKRIGAYVCAMVGDPCISQYSGHAYPCTIVEGMFFTEVDKRLSPSLPFPFSHLLTLGAHARRGLQ